jgi:Skp family chaperone for outer membrane proteins
MWLAAGLAALMFGMGKPVAAQESAAPAPKVAVINIATVFSKYEKASRFKKEMEDMLQPYKKDIESMQQEVANLKKLKEVPMQNPAVVDQLQERLTQKNRQIEDTQTRARKEIGAKSEQQLILLWNEISLVVRRQAEAQGFTLVLSYGEPVGNELGIFAKINRKMTALEAGGTIPLYIHPSIDITDAVTRQLNDAYRKESPKNDPRVVSEL